MAVFLRHFSTIAKFSSDLLNTNEDIAPQSQALQAFVLWQERGGRGGEGRGTNFVSLRSFIRIKSINLDKVDRAVFT